MSRDPLHTGRIRVPPVSSATIRSGIRQVQQVISRDMERQRNRRCGSSHHGTNLLFTSILFPNHHITGHNPVTSSRHIVLITRQTRDEQIRRTDRVRIGPTTGQTQVVGVMLIPNESMRVMSDTRAVITIVTDCNRVEFVTTSEAGNVAVIRTGVTVIVAEIVSQIKRKEQDPIRGVTGHRYRIRLLRTHRNVLKCQNCSRGRSVGSAASRLNLFIHRVLKTKSAHQISCWSCSKGSKLTFWKEMRETAGRGRHLNCLPEACSLSAITIITNKGTVPGLTSAAAQTLIRTTRKKRM